MPLGEPHYARHSQPETADNPRSIINRTDQAVRGPAAVLHLTYGSVQACCTFLLLCTFWSIRGLLPVLAAWIHRTAPCRTLLYLPYTVVLLYIPASYWRSAAKAPFILMDIDRTPPTAAIRTLLDRWYIGTFREELVNPWCNCQ